MSETDELERFERKKDELHDGLLTAYAAGFSKAVETFDLDPDFDTNVNSLRENRAVAECHYYFWDGRTLPLEFWIRDQFDLDNDGTENTQESDGGDA